LTDTPEEITGFDGDFGTDSGLSLAGIGCSLLTIGTSTGLEFGTGVTEITAGLTSLGFDERTGGVVRTGLEAGLFR
jgi:hypothetical protein